MTNLNNEQMKQYLKTIVKLESSINQQEEIVEKAKKGLVKEEIVKNDSVPFSAPTKPEFEEFMFKKPTFKLFETSMSRGEIRLIIIALIIFGIVFTRAIIWAYDQGAEILVNFFWGVLFVLLAVLGVIFIVRRSSDYKYYKEQLLIYNQNLERYNKNYKDNYDQQLQEYNKEYSEYLTRKSQYLNDSQIKYQNNLKIADKNFELASKEFNKISNALQETKNDLQTLYDKNIIFEKYRNFVAMCSIYEYFSSGRVDTLEGPNGAYNLYESELRQNLIVNSLDKISSNLEVVKSNQFILYNELINNSKELNTKLSDISNSLNKTLHSVKNIEGLSRITAESSYINAYCSQVTAENSTLMSTMTFLN